MSEQTIKRVMKVQIDYTDKHAPRCSYNGVGRVLRKASSEYGSDCWECRINDGTGVFDSKDMKEVK